MNSWIDKLRELASDLLDRWDILLQRLREIAGQLEFARSPNQPDIEPTSFQRLSDVKQLGSNAAPVADFTASTFTAPKLPSSAPVYAIGDVHGRADLLDALMEVVVEDAKTSKGRPQIVFLGDYIDRGFQSREVISALIELEKNDAFETTFLKGNHEQAMLHFLKNHSIGPDWAAFGGRETLISYSIAPPKAVNVVEEWEPIQKELVKTIPSDHVDFLERLAVSHKIGPYGFVHAGVKPGVPYEDQADEDCLWIREEFLDAPDKEDLFIVHGHTPVNAPFKDHRRVNVDTGAYFTGRLTAVKISGDQMSFLTNTLPSQES